MNDVIINKIKIAISNSTYKTAFTVFDFLNLGNYETVRKSIARLEKQGFIKRIMRGYYYKPCYSKTLNMWSMSNVDDIVHAMARARGWQICFTGDMALNILGLSTQIPNVYVYASTGPNKTIIINNCKVKLVRRRQQDFTCDNITNLLIQSMKTKGQSNIDQNFISTCRNKLSNKQKTTIQKTKVHTSKWIVDTLATIMR